MCGWYRVDKWPKGKIRGKDPYDPQADNEADDPFILQHSGDQAIGLRHCGGKQHHNAPPG